MDCLFVSCSNEKFKHQEKDLINYSLQNVKLSKQRTFLSPYWLLRSQENNMSPSLCQRSLELCIFCKSSCCPSSWFCFCHYVSARFLAVWGVLPPTHVSFKEEMINMWLQVGSREAGDGWEWHFVDRLSLMPVWRICWAFLCMVSLTNWKIHSKTHSFWSRHFKLKTIARRNPSYLPQVAWTNWINLSPTKWELYYSH